MNEPWLIILSIFFISLVSNALNGIISGAASLIGTSLMLLLGLPPHITMSTYVFGAVPARLSAAWGYRKSGKILWQHMPLLAALGFVASLAGALLLVRANQQTVMSIVSAALIIFIPLAFVRAKRGVMHVKPSRRRLVAGFATYFILAAWASFFAAWTGILFLFLYLYLFGYTILETKATESIAGLAAAFGAIIVFSLSGTFNLWYIAAYIPGAIVGGYCGSKLALRTGDARLRMLVWVSISAVSIKTLVQIKLMQYLQPIMVFFR